MAVTNFQRPLPAHLGKLIRRAAWLVCLPACAAHAQGPAPTSVSACPVQPSYPLPTEAAKLQALSDRLQALANQKGCLVDADFHAWRGAVLMALGRPIEAVEPLERALMANPDLPGAQLDLAQSLSLQGDRASAIALLMGLKERTDVPAPLRVAIDTQLATLTALEGKPGAQPVGWQSRFRVTALAGADSNLNNAPSSSEITLTLPQGDQTFALDQSSLARAGGAATLALQWQGLRPRGEQLWVAQAEVRGRRTADRATGFEQADLALAWLQAPAAPRQWVARASTSYLRFGGVSLLQAYRASLQRQLAPLGGGEADAPGGNGRCRPTLGVEGEHRRYPSSPSITGLYTGAVAGLLCRPANGKASGHGSAAALVENSFVNLEVHVGEDRPQDASRAGGVYRRSELRGQWEIPVFAGGQAGLQWSTTRQVDTEPYSPLLGNIPRSTLRHALQAEASWPLRDKLSLVSNAEAAIQKSNITAFASRQRSFYLGLRWELTQ